VVQPRAQVDIVATALCGEKWGHGQCENKLGVVSRDHLASCKQRLRVWAAATKLVPARFDEFLSKLPLFWFGRSGDAAGSAEDVRGYAMLLVDVEGHPAKCTFFVNRCLQPQVGTTLRFQDFSICNFMDDNSVARIVAWRVLVAVSNISLSTVWLCLHQNCSSCVSSSYYGEA
jgi:hypothetical protein